MRVTTRVISGFGVLMAVAVAALAYQIWVIHQMQSINRDLSSINFQAGSIALRLQKPAAEIDEFTRKYFGSGDPLYRTELDPRYRDLLEAVATLRQLVRTDRERQEIQRLSDVVDAYWVALNGHRPAPGLIEIDPPAEVRETLANLVYQTQATLAAVEAAIPEQVARATAVGERAEQISLIAGAVAVLLGIIVSILMVRAISEPLKQLTNGTRRISQGQFWHRIPDRGKDEFAEVARNFNAMTQRLGELDQLKKDFVSHVSHELKAPLASMRQVFHLLLQKIAGPLNEQQEKLVRLSNNSAERLSAMVGNLLDVSRLEAGTMEYQIETHDLSGLVRSVAEEFQVQVDERNLRLDVETPEGPFPVECDRDRIIQVVGNLLENALKFAPDGTRILVRVQYTEEPLPGFVRPPSNRGSSGFGWVSVADSGTGVPAGHKERIFLKFHQVKQGRKIAGQGVGLGLAICKTILEAHNGRIWVDDNPGGGSVFSFVLLAAAPPKPSPQDKSEVLECG